MVFINLYNIENVSLFVFRSSLEWSTQKWSKIVAVTFYLQVRFAFCLWNNPGFEKVPKTLFYRDFLTRLKVKGLDSIEVMINCFKEFFWTIKQFLNSFDRLCIDSVRIFLLFFCSIEDDNQMTINIFHSIKSELTSLSRSITPRGRPYMTSRIF